MRLTMENYKDFLHNLKKTIACLGLWKIIIRGRFSKKCQMTGIKIYSNCWLMSRFQFQFWTSIPIKIYNPFRRLHCHKLHWINFMISYLHQLRLMNTINFASFRAGKYKIPREINKCVCVCWKNIFHISIYVTIIQ